MFLTLLLSAYHTLSQTGCLLASRMVTLCNEMTRPLLENLHIQENTPSLCFPSCCGDRIIETGVTILGYKVILGMRSCILEQLGRKSLGPGFSQATLALVYPPKLFPEKENKLLSCSN